MRISGSRAFFDPGDPGWVKIGSEIRAPRLGIRDQGSEIRDPRSGIRDPGSEIRDPRSEIRDPGSEIRDPGWVKIRSRDKNPGSATLILTLEEDIVLEPVTVEPVNSRGNIGL